MDNTLSEMSQKLIISLQNSLSNPLGILHESDALCNQLQHDSSAYCCSLIKILTLREDIALRLICAIQLKNSISRQWKTVFSGELKLFIKQNLLLLLLSSKSKPELKQYKESIRRILKRDSQWGGFMNTIQQWISSFNENQFKGYCGVLGLWLLANKYEFELDNRQVYDECYATTHCQLLQTFIALIQKDNVNELDVKCIGRIIKVWIKSIKITPPVVFTNDFDVLYLRLIAYTPQNIKLRRNCLFLLEAIYQKYFYGRQGIKKGNNTSSVCLLENWEKYAPSLFNYFFSYIVDCNKHLQQIDERSMTSCYNSLSLALNRKDKMIFSAIQQNLQHLIAASIQNNILNLCNLDYNDKNFIYDQFDIPLYSKRKPISSFLEKIASIKQIEAEAILILINQLSLIDNARRQNESEENVLMKESALFLLMKMLQKRKSTDASSIIHEIVAKYISNEITSNANNANISTITLKFQCIDFLNLVLNSASFTQEEINYLINSLSEGLVLDNPLIIKTISAMTLSSLIAYSSESIAYAQNSITKLLSLYIVLIKEVELDQLIDSIENIINHYPKETLTFASELSKELIVIFHKYMTELKECDVNEATTLDSAAVGIVDLLWALIKICNESSKLNEVIVNCNDMMCYALSKECGAISMMVFERALWFTTNLIEIVKETPQLMWKWFEIIMSGIVSYENIQSEPLAGIGYELFLKIMPIAFYFIIKDPNTFILVYDRTLIIIEAVITISHSKEDELCCCYAITILIAIFETYDSSALLIQKSLDRLLPLLLKELSLDSKQMYLQFLIQLIALVIKFNPLYAINRINEMNQLNALFSMWVSAISSMQYLFEYRRSIYGLFSLLCLDIRSMPVAIRDNFSFLIEKGYEMTDKLLILNEKNAKKIDEAEVSGDVSEEEAEDDFSFQSDDGFIEKDDYDEEYDEDYSPENEVKQSSNKMLCSKLEKDNVFIWLRTMLLHTKTINNGEQYALMMSLIHSPLLLNTLSLNK